jgi:hypothetical protein
MKYVALALALLAAGTGLLAALYWHRASKVQIIPMWEEQGRMEPVSLAQGNTEWIVGLLKTGEKSSYLNKVAAQWTAVSVFLGALSSLAGAV